MTRRRCTLPHFHRLALALPLLALLTGCTTPRPQITTAPPPVRPPVPAAVVRTPPPYNPNLYAGMSLRAQDSRIPVIMYHDIVEKRGPGTVWFDCTKEEFAAQLQWLVDRGAQPISLEALHRHLTRGEPVPVGAVVLTFDDNYQGFYDYAYPLLKQYNFPAAMFVHTNYVGDKTGAHPKMDWDTLRALDAEGLVTIGSHTLSHPEDMRLLPAEKQEEELIRSKEILEQELGHDIPFLAYPNGRADAVTIGAALRAGYTMAFTIANGPAEQSPGILAVNRYIHTRLEKAWKDAEEATLNAPATVVEKALKPTPVQLEVAEFEGVKLGLVRGGMPSTRRSTGRQGVGEFVKEAGGAAGINGTFFANAFLRGTDNTMIGPCLTTSEKIFLPETAEFRLPRLVNRPLVLWGATRIAVVPFQPGYMNDLEPLKALMPDLTDVFLAGGWIVHNGIARTEEELRPHAVSDFKDPRRRAFFGFTHDGEVVLGASLQVVSTPRLAEAAAAAGVAEAFLLDSGFSTSLVYDGKIIVTGHTARHLPSRPVPHAIVLAGTVAPPLDPEVKQLLAKADSALVPTPPEGTGSRRRRSRQ